MDLTKQQQIKGAKKTMKKTQDLKKLMPARLRFIRIKKLTERIEKKEKEIKGLKQERKELEEFRY
tara:strand:+ start:246 stop:440 length:195 start_codon:yes stop_codon:yes gene_type:complete